MLQDLQVLQAVSPTTYVSDKTAVGPDEQICVLQETSLELA